MSDKMMRIAGRGTDGLAKALKTDNEGTLTVFDKVRQDENLKNKGIRKLATHEVIEQERNEMRNRFLKSERLIGNGDSATLSGWVKYGTGQMAQSTQHKESGTGAVKLVSSDNKFVGAARVGSFNFSEDTHFRLWAYSPDPSKIAKFRITLYSPDSNNTYYEDPNRTILLGLKRRNGAPCELSISKADFLSYGNPDWSNITTVLIEVQSVSGQTCEVYFDNLRAQTTNVSKGKVVLRFDDGFASVHKSAYPAMINNCLPGVAVVNPATIGTVETWMTKEQLEDLNTYGWDISSHAWRGVSFLTRTGHQAFNDLKATQNWLVNNGFERGSRFHVFSNHNVNESVLDAALKLYHINNSGIFGHETLPFGDPKNLRFLGGDNKTLEQLIAYVDACALNKTLAIITFHNIIPGGGPYDADPTIFANFAAHLGQRDDIDVVTFSDLLDGTWIGTR